MDYRKTDPEFAERFEHFAFDEVVNEQGQQQQEGQKPPWLPKGEKNYPQQYSDKLAGTAGANGEADSSIMEGAAVHTVATKENRQPLIKPRKHD